MDNAFKNEDSFPGDQLGQQNPVVKSESRSFSAKQVTGVGALCLAVGTIVGWYGKDRQVKKAEEAGQEDEASESKKTTTKK